MQYFLNILLHTLLVTLLVMIIRPLTVLFHELGHAIPAILMTKEKVTVYVGSYGDPRKSIRSNIGSLELYFQYNPFSWRTGLCVPSAKNISLNRQIIFTITGPITSITIAIISCYFTFIYDLHDFLKLYLLGFLVSSSFDLLVNLIPRNVPVRLYDGTLVYNDGYKLKQLFYYKHLPKEWTTAVELYNEQRYSEAITLVEKIMSGGVKDENVYRLAISSYLQERKYEKAKELSERLSQLGKMNADDLSNAALSYSQLGLHEKAMELYDRSLQQDPDNKYALINKGYTLVLLNRFEEAIAVFDKAIELDKNFAYSYSNRGLSKIKLGQPEEGLKDINYSIELDKTNSFGYRNLGIYHLDKGEYNEALLLFTKAKELDSTTHMIDELIIEAKQYI